MRAPSYAVPLVKTRTRKQRKSADDRYADKVRDRVRERDPICRAAGIGVACQGGLIWCHMEGYRRAQTRLQPKEQRHSRLWTLMLCVAHGHYEETRQLVVRYVTEAMCDGAIAWTWQPWSVNR